MSVVNCRDCGKVMLERRIRLCNDCIESQKEDLLKIKEYLSNNREASIMDVVQHTGLSLNRIRELTAGNIHA
ncbi:hypothetical protein SD71_12225 [Cohnella kolymensis]|uniref:Flagellar protein n=1 Tax=Cohnella kolymensis TaxID=1590652 RepID=A0ABR5A3P8_9BACL|nr:hypothetical protein [Cohnella kolymensis]KIL35659.1 hypothetical protein SD71_12225 [Cohnella kolymensis]